MSIYVQEPKLGAEFEKAPTGECQAVLVELIDLGWQMQTHEGQNKGMGVKVWPVFQLAKEDAEGNRHEVRAKPMFVKWNFKEGQESNWVKFLMELFGKSTGIEIARTAVETRHFDERTLIGANMLVTVVHTPAKDRNGNDRVYANIEEMTRWRDSMGEKLVPKDYIPAIARENYKEPDFPGTEAYPGDVETGAIDPSWTRGQSQGPPAAQTGVPLTPQHKAAILREAARVAGANNTVAYVKKEIGDVDQLTYDGAEDWISYLKGLPPLPKAAASAPAVSAPPATPPSQAEPPGDDSDPFADD